MQMKVNQVIFVGFGMIFLMTLIGTATADWSQKKIIIAGEEIAVTYRIKAYLNALEKSLVDAETGQRGFIYTNINDFLTPYSNGKNQLEQNFILLRTDLSQDQSQLQILAEINDLSQQKMQELEETILLKKSGKEEEVRRLVLSGKGKNIMDEIRVKIRQMLEMEEKKLATKEAEAHQVYKIAQVTSWGSAFLVIGLGVVIALIVAKVIMKTIEQAASSIATSAIQLATTVEQQERIARNQAISINQTTSTMQELNISANQAAVQAESSAQAARHVGSLVMRLSEQTTEISKMNTLVTELANQTNMLALNAAVEAVRAGEQGRGFNVVAGEIRRLADQSKKSADNIGVLVSDIKMLASNGGINSSDMMKIDNIVTAANNIILSSQQISLASKQQAMAIQQVLEAMNAINQGAEETASGMTQTKTSIQMLSKAAEHLKSLGIS